MTIEEKFSFHIRTERKERFDFINSTIGMGEPIARCRKARDENGDAIAILTNTGVIIIESTSSKRIITMYIASISQANEIWHRAQRKTKMPQALWMMINYNNNTDWYKANVYAF